MRWSEMPFSTVNGFDLLDKLRVWGKEMVILLDASLMTITTPKIATLPLPLPSREGKIY